MSLEPLESERLRPRHTAGPIFMMPGSGASPALWRIKVNVRGQRRRRKYSSEPVRDSPQDPAGRTLRSRPALIISQHTRTTHHLIYNTLEN